MNEASTFATIAVVLAVLVMGVFVLWAWQSSRLVSMEGDVEARRRVAVAEPARGPYRMVAERVEAFMPQRLDVAERVGDRDRSGFGAWWPRGRRSWKERRLRA